MVKYVFYKDIGVCSGDGNNLFRHVMALLIKFNLKLNAH